MDAKFFEELELEKTIMKRIGLSEEETELVLCFRHAEKFKNTADCSNAFEYRMMIAEEQASAMECELEGKRLKNGNEMTKNDYVERDRIAYEMDKLRKKLWGLEQEHRKISWI